MLDSTSSSDSSVEATSPPRTRRSSAGGAKQNGSTAREDIDTTTDDDDGAERRLTRAQAKTRVASSETDSDDSGRKTRRRRRGKEKPSPSPPPAKSNHAKDTGKPPRPAPSYPSEDEDNSDAPGDYIPVQVGDTVLLDSGEEDPYIALVSSVQTSQRRDKPIASFTAQWYYKPEDVAEDVLALIPGGVGENEVFLSPHKDKNSIDAVIEICQVVSPEEYNDIQDEIKRGFREKGKTYFVCRYKYYPNRANHKKALEAVENDAIRSGLGRPKPNVGDKYQAVVPAFKAPPPSSIIDQPEATPQVPWRVHPDPKARPRQVWSPLVPRLQKDAFFSFLEMVDTLRFAVSNIVKMYRDDSKRKGHIRGIVLRSPPRGGDVVRLCLSTGEEVEVLTSEVCSLLPEDVAMQHLYLSRFNVCLAAQECSRQIMDAQQSERDAFIREVVLFSQVTEEERAEKERATASPVDVDSSRKRRK